MNLVHARQESNITCPDCKKTSSIPTGGVEQLPNNFFINRLLDETSLKLKVEGKEEVRCGLCVREDSAVVEVLCVDCGKFLCTYCFDNHKYSRTEYQSHETITLKTLQSREEGPNINPKVASCHEHQLELKFYCETCNRLVCEYCIMKDHLKHYHDIVKEKATKHRKELDRIMEPVENIEAELCMVNIKISKVRDEIETKANEIEKEIDKYYEELYQRLQQQRDELKKELHETSRQKKKEVTQQLEQIENTQVQLNGAKELNNAIKKGSDQEILLMEKKLVDDVKKLSDSYNKLDTQPVQLTTTEFIPVEEYKKLMPQFGHLFDGACSHASEIINVPKWVFEGEDIEFKIITRDRNNHVCNKGGSEVVIHAQSSRDVASVEVKDNKDGSYSASFVANQVGEVKLSVTIKGQQIKGSPFNVKVCGKYTTIDKPSKVITKVGWMGTPWGIAFGKNGLWAVTDRSNHCVRIFDSHDKMIQTFGANGSDKGKFNSPTGIAFDDNNHLYVTDSWNNRVQKFTVTGTCLLQFGSHGSGNGQLNNPLGILVLNRHVYVVENSGNRISVFQLDGQFSHIIGSNYLKNPCYIAVNAIDQLLVANSGHHCISIFTRDGGYVSKFGTRGTGKGQLKNPTGIATDMYGFIFVTEEHNNRVSIYDKDRNFLHSFGSKGSGHGQFLLPRGITIYSGDVYICDSKNERVQIF